MDFGSAKIIGSKTSKDRQLSIVLMPGVSS